MKFWKKAVSFVMALGLTVSAVGCFATDGSSGSGNSGNSDSSSGSRVELTKDVAMTNLEEVLESTKSFKLLLEAEAEVKGVSTVEVNGSLNVSIDEDGVDMYLWLSAAVDYVDATEEDTSMEADIYLIDDYAYVYNKQDKTYMKSTMSLTELVEDALTEAGLTMTQAEGYIAELSAALTAAGVTQENVLGELKETGTLSNDSISWTVDGKDLVNPVLDFLGNYDTNKTLETALNEAITALGLNTNVDAILDSVGALGTLKVSEAVATVNAFLTLNYQTNLQAILDAALADEMVVAILISNGLSQDQIDAFKQIKIADVVAAYGEMTIDDVLNMFMASSAPSAPAAEGGAQGGGSGTVTSSITLKGLTDMAKAYLEATKIVDLDPEMIPQIQMVLKMTDVTKLDGKVGVHYDAEANVSEIVFEAGFGVAMGTGVAAMTATAAVKITALDFSENTVSIALPAGATEVLPE